MVTVIHLQFEGVGVGVGVNVGVGVGNKSHVYSLNISHPLLTSIILTMTESAFSKDIVAGGGYMLGNDDGK